MRCGMARWQGHLTVHKTLLHLVKICVLDSAETNLHLSSSKSCDYGTCDSRAHAIFYGSRLSIMAAMRNEVVAASLLCAIVVPSRQTLCSLVVVFRSLVRAEFVEAPPASTIAL